MGHLGFSLTGLFWVFAAAIPNLFFAFLKPPKEPPLRESSFWLVCERVGQGAIFICLLIFSDTTFAGSQDPWSCFFFLALLFLSLYEAAWLRYFLTPRTADDFYGSFLGFPLPLALLPILSLAFLAFYAQLLWLALATCLFAAGHLSLHIDHLRNLQSR